MKSYEILWKQQENTNKYVLNTNESCGVARRPLEPHGVPWSPLGCAAPWSPFSSLESLGVPWSLLDSLGVNKKLKIWKFQESSKKYCNMTGDLN